MGILRCLIHKKIDDQSDKVNYQTVLKPVGSVAPTAGLHFTKNLLSQIKAKGRNRQVTLHVGLVLLLGETEKVEDHKIHSDITLLRKN